MVHAFSERTLTELIRAHDLPGDGPTAFVPTRTGKYNTSYYVDLGSSRYVLRIAPPDGTVTLFYETNMMAQEPEVHELVRAQTRAPVARVLAYDCSRRLIDRDYIIMERLPGVSLAEANVTPQVYARVLRQVGECLAEVHAITAGQYGYLGAHHPIPPQDDWASAFVLMWNRLLNDVEMVGGYAPHEAQAMRDLLTSYLPHFRRPAPASLLHMDIWSENILVDREGNLTGLLDWDRALWGDPEIEFAVLDYCSISQPAFWEGYGRERDVSRPAQIRQRFYLLYELQKYIVIEAGRRGDADAARYYRDESIRLALPLAGGRP